MMATPFRHHHALHRAVVVGTKPIVRRDTQTFELTIDDQTAAVFGWMPHDRGP